MSRAGVAMVAVLAAGLPATSSSAEPRPVSIALDAHLRCPDQGAISAALARLGRRVSTQGAAVALERRPDGVRVLLSDHGALLLDRVLPHARCDAVAEAIAFMVDRRLAGVEWSGAVPAPVRRTPTVSAVAPGPALSTYNSPARPDLLRLRAAFVALRSFDERVVAPGVAAGAALDGPGPLEISLMVGWIAHGSFAAGPGSVSVDEIPVNVGLLASWSSGRVELGAEAKARVGFLFARGDGLDEDASAIGVGLHVGPAGWAGVAILEWLGLWTSLAAELAVLPQDVVVQGLGTVARASPVALEWTLGLSARPNLHH